MRAADRKIPCLRGRGCTPHEGQDILAERKSALNAMPRSPFSDENATRKITVCVTCFICTGGTFALDVRMFRHRRSTPIGLTGGTGSLLGMQCPKQMNDNSDCCSFAPDGSDEPSGTIGFQKAAPSIVVQYCNRRPAQIRVSKAVPITCVCSGIPGSIPFNHTYS